MVRVLGGMNSRELSQNNHSTNSGGDFLAALDAESDVDIAVADDDEGLEPVLVGLIRVTVRTILGQTTIQIGKRAMIQSREVGGGVSASSSRWLVGLQMGMAARLRQKAELGSVVARPGFDGNKASSSPAGLD
ncbi:hypothetical protein M0R45_035627 [Rubus argutus]|uniref:Uncharacterized protein n=1 Tax=Rubus argutus TaxID=59490 RepID=A0AAW1VVF9_RUBAR